MMKETDMTNLNTFEGIKGYATYAAAMRKLKKEIPSDNIKSLWATSIQCHVAISSEGRFIPVAVGERAVQAGLHFRGVAIVG